ncbi:MAG: hypothetical protein K0R19_3567, partial [Bacillota bacterium]|nr:hypothetical protein [Bacillota bacterium]
RAAPISAAIQCHGAGRKVHFAPMYTAAKAPIINCPAAPMLNKPVLNAKPTDRPVRISGVAKYSTWPIPLAPVLNPPFNMMTKPSAAWDGLLRSNTTNPNSKPIRMEKMEEYALLNALLINRFFNRYRPDSNLRRFLLHRSQEFGH